MSAYSDAFERVMALKDAPNTSCQHTKRVTEMGFMLDWKCELEAGHAGPHRLRIYRDF